MEMVIELSFAPLGTVERIWSFVLLSDACFVAVATLDITALPFAAIYASSGVSPASLNLANFWKFGTILS